jgi:ribokinase
MKALCFGSLNIDYTYKVPHFVIKGETLSSDDLLVFPGGKGLNQSVALSKSGVETYHAGCIGNEGLFLIETLINAGIQTDFVSVLENVKSGHAIIQSQKDGDNCILLYGGANQQITKKQIDEVLSHFHKEDYLVLQNEINNMEYLINTAHSKGLKIVLTPAPMTDAVFNYPLKYIDYLLLNKGEASALLHTQLTEENFMSKDSIQKIGVLFSKQLPKATVVLTLGEKGAICFTKESYFVQKAYSVSVVDTTAAGDTFAGFFIGSVMLGKTIVQALDIASKAASLSVTRLGASISIPSIEEVLKF